MSEIEEIQEKLKEIERRVKRLEMFSPATFTNDDLAQMFGTQSSTTKQDDDKA
jgi:hypothetical protein